MRGRYLLFQRAEAVLLDQKASKLFHLTQLLDNYLTSDFDVLLYEAGLSPEVGHAAKLAVLNSKLSDFTELVAQSFPGVGVGYYSADLDCILTYGPKSDYGDKVGISVAEDHIGKRCMRAGHRIMGVGSMVRGDIMNCVQPLMRRGRAIGFVWANETIEDIYSQMAEGGMDLFFSADVEPLLGLTGLLVLSSSTLLAGAAGDHANGAEAVKTQAFGRVARYLRLFLNSLSLGLAIADERDRIIFANRGLERLSGIAADRIVGQNAGEFLRAIGIPVSGVVDGTGELAGSGEAAGAGPVGPTKAPYTVARVKLRPAGGSSAMGADAGTDAREIEVNFITARIAPLWDNAERPGWSKQERDDAEVPGGVVYLFEDMKGAREEEERLRRAEQLAAAGELAAAIAHEIKNPLTVVAGSVQLIPEKLDDHEFLAGFARIAADELERVNRTLESLLNFARFAEPVRRPVDVNSVVRGAVDLVRAYAQQQGVTVLEIYASDLPFVYADGEHLKQAFLNLLLNALQAMPKGGVLAITTRQESRSRLVQVIFSDTGEGIPPELEEKIFSLFFTTKPGGSGLGLPLVQRIVDEHGGFLFVDSSVGEGSRFTVCLPSGLYGG